MVKIYALGGEDPDSNIFIILDSKIAMVDAGTGKRFNRIKKEIEERGIDPKDIELIINTHCHYDHAGGDFDFVIESGCRIAIHEKEANYLRTGDWHFTLSELFFGEKMRAVEVERELRDGDVIDLGELKLRVLHTPGHTAGSVCLYDSEKRLLFSGDTVFGDGIGRTDLPSGDWRELGDSLRRLADLNVEKIYPGHGPVVEEGGKNCIRRVLETFYPETR